MSIFIGVSLSSSLQHLQVDYSLFALIDDPATDDQVLRFDFERGKDPYPEAHVQVYGKSQALERINDNQSEDRSLKDLHIPVGGAMFRPSLEDFIEFLILERFAKDPRPDWRSVLDESRERYWHRQLEAAVRRMPDIAAERLRSMGYRITPPCTPSPDQPTG